MSWSVSAKGKVADVRASLRDQFQVIVHHNNFSDHVAQHAARAIESAVAILPEDAAVEVAANGSVTVDQATNHVTSSALTIDVKMV